MTTFRENGAVLTGHMASTWVVVAAVTLLLLALCICSIILTLQSAMSPDINVMMAPPFRPNLHPDVRARLQASNIAGVVLSFGSSPHRWTQTGPVITSLLQQRASAWIPCIVSIALPRTFRGEPAIYPRHQTPPEFRDPRVLVLEGVEDLGPATKVVHAGCIAAKQGWITVSADDDTVYPPDWLTALLLGVLEHPDSIVGVQGGVLWECGSEVTTRAQAPFQNHATLGGLEAHFVEGFAGIAYPPRFFEREAALHTYFQTLPSPCRLGDDLSLSMWAYGNGIPIHMLSDNWFAAPYKWQLDFGMEDVYALHATDEDVVASQRSAWRTTCPMVSTYGHCSSNTMRYAGCMKSMVRRARELGAWGDDALYPALRYAQDMSTGVGSIVHPPSR